jgi:hypothetical protein
VAASAQPRAFHPVGLLKATAMSTRGKGDGKTRGDPTMMATGKISWSGRLAAVQPRSRLTRSFDQRSHTYQGYVLRTQGRIGEEQHEFLVAVGATAHADRQFRPGDRLSGEGARTHRVPPELTGGTRSPSRRQLGP